MVKNMHLSNIRGPKHMHCRWLYDCFYNSFHESCNRFFNSNIFCFFFFVFTLRQRISLFLFGTFFRARLLHYMLEIGFFLPSFLRRVACLTITLLNSAALPRRYHFRLFISNRLSIVYCAPQLLNSLQYRHYYCQLLPHQIAYKIVDCIQISLMLVLYRWQTKPKALWQTKNEDEAEEM